jgi:hypothetical protein
MTITEIAEQSPGIASRAVGFASEDLGSFVSLADVVFGRKKVRNMASLSDQEWTRLVLENVRQEDAPSNLALLFLDNRTIFFHEAVGSILKGTELGSRIVEIKKEELQAILGRLDKERGESCER